MRKNQDAYPQSGAGHHLASGSAARSRRMENSSNFNIKSSDSPSKSLMSKKIWIQKMLNKEMETPLLDNLVRNHIEL